MNENKILVACPCLNDIDVKTVVSIQSLCMPTIYLADSLIYVARDLLAQEAINGGYDYILFVDSDIQFSPDCVESLLSHDTDVVSGLYVQRKDKHLPVIYNVVEPRTKEHNAKVEIQTDISKDYFQIEGCGMGFCLIKTEVLKKIAIAYKSCFEPIAGLGEDLSFCYKCKTLGIPIYCDNTFELTHNGTYGYTLKDWIKDE